MGDAPSTPRNEAFISYSHEDAEWLTRFRDLLKPYVRRKRLEVWADPYIPVGARWEREIASALRRARVGVLLCSPDFTASDFIAEVELPALLEAEATDGVRLFCIPVRWLDPEPLGLHAIQWARPPDQPLDRLRRPEREKVMVELVQRLVALFDAGPAPRASLEPLDAPAQKSPEPKVTPLGRLAGGSLGKLHGVPELPPHFVARGAALDELRAALLEQPRQNFAISASLKAGLYGQGGIGKTVLATALARDEDVQRAFPDGVYWLTLGQEPNRVALQQSLALALTNTWLPFESEPAGTLVLRQALEGKTCLLVLDDVWQSSHAKAFEVLGPKGRVLITTRDRSLFDGLTAYVQNLDLFGPGAARALLAQWAGQPETGLPPEADAVAEQCGYLPLALSLAGAQVSGGATWQDVLRALEQGDLRFLDHPHGSVFKSLSASVQALSAHEAERYRELAIFPEDAEIPEEVVVTSWGASGMSAERARQLLRTFASRALLTLSGEAGARHVTFHDLQGDYLRLIVDGVPEIHRKLLAAHYQALPGTDPGAARWASLPASSKYLWEHLVDHLFVAGDRESVTALIGDARWLAAKVSASGVAGLLGVLQRVAERDPSPRHRLIERVVRLESSWLHRDPGALPGLMYNRLRSEGLSAGEIEGCVSHLRPPVRLLHPVNLGGAELRQFRGHTDSVTACAYSLDGTRVLSASEDGTLREWDRSSGTERQRFEGHSAGVTGCAYSPDGTRVLSASEDGTLREWDRSSGTELRRFEGHSDSVTACAYSPDGTRVLSASRDGTLREWDRSSGTERQRFEGHSAGVTACAYSPDGTRVLSASDDETVREWERSSGIELHRFEGHSVGVTACEYSPDGTRVLSASYDNTLREWDPSSGTEIRRFEGHSDSVTGCAYSPDGTRVLSASCDNTLREWERSSGTEIRRFEGHSESVNACACSPDGTRVLSASPDKTLREWDCSLGIELQRFEGRSTWFIDCAYSPDGARVLSASEDRTLREWDRSSGTELRRFKGHSVWVTACAYSPDGSRVLSASGDGTLREWECSSGTERQRFEGHSAWVTDCAYSPDGTRVLSASRDGTLREWERSSGTERQRFEGHSAWVISCAYSPDGTRVLSASRDGTLREWERSSGTERQRFEGHTGAVESCGYSLDGRRILSASADSTLKIWARDTGRCLYTIYGAAPFWCLSSTPGLLAAGDYLGNLWILEYDDL